MTTGRNLPFLFSLNARRFRSIETGGTTRLEARYPGPRRQFARPTDRRRNKMLSLFLSARRMFSNRPMFNGTWTAGNALPVLGRRRSPELFIQHLTRRTGSNVVTQTNNKPRVLFGYFAAPSPDSIEIRRLVSTAGNLVVYVRVGPAGLPQVAAVLCFPQGVATRLRRDVVFKAGSGQLCAR